MVAGHVKDSLWSVDLFRCESILLRSHWVIVVMDVFTRRIIGFGVERADLCGMSICRMFSWIIAGKSLPRHLSVCVASHRIGDGDESSRLPFLSSSASDR
jgi:hypothetical protein